MLTTAEVIYALLKHYPHAYAVKEAVTAHRVQNPNWNWACAAHDLLATLEGGAKWAANIL